MKSDGTPNLILHPPAADRPCAGLDKLARELNENLAALQSALRQLLDIAGQKLAALRRADADTLQLCTAHESELLDQVFRVDQQRNAILARAAQSLPARATAKSRLAELVPHFPEPFSSALQARSAALRQIAGELQRKNRLVANVARDLQVHLQVIFAELAQVNRESLVYGPKGQHESHHVRFWLDAVG